MLTGQLTDVVFTQLLDALPDAVVLMRALRNKENQIVNFQVEYSNQKAQAENKGVYEVQPGMLVLGDNPIFSQESFQEMCFVLETGQPQEFSYFNTLLNEWLLINRTKLGDGILSVTRNISALKSAEETNTQQAQLINSVLDGSPNGIKALKAVRDEAGTVIDFVVLAINKAGAIIRGRAVSDIVGRHILEIFPGVREAGLFDQYVQVTETREPRHIRTRYGTNGIESWYDMALSPFGDGITVTYTDITENYQAQQAVEHQAALLNSVLNGSINGIMAFKAVRDGEGNIQDFAFLSVNEAGCQLVGKSVHQLMGSTLLTHFPGNIETGLFDLYVRTTETGEPIRTETYYYYDGLNTWFDISTQQLSDGFVVTFSDVSLIKQVTTALEQSTIELRAVIDSAQVAIYLINPVRNEAGQIVDFRFRIANQMLARYVGQEPDTLIGELVSRWFPDYLTNGLFWRYVAIFETGRTQHFNFHLNSDDMDSWINITSIRLGNDVLVTFSDYTELKKLQQRLEASASELQTVIDNCQTGIFLFSPVRGKDGDVTDFRFRVANRQLASYVGQEPDTVIGALGSRWFPGYKANELFEMYLKTYLTGEAQRFEFHYDQDGIDVWLDIMATKMGDEVLVTFSDYTPLKQLQQELENSVADLQRSNKNLEQFAYVASHDLQEPLRKIQAFGDIIQSQYGTLIGESGADMIGRMQSAASRMQVLIRDVLAYSRIATKRETTGSVDLSKLVSEVLGDLETAINDKRAVVTVEPLPTVRGDAAQLRQLFQNLISNALKFTKREEDAYVPTITITGRMLRGRECLAVPVSPADADRPFYLIEVVDNGIGFDPYQSERIFQVFQRLHGRNEYRGTGIGLAIVQKVVDNHHGYIAAEGRPGQGATFRVLLPA